MKINTLQKKILLSVIIFISASLLACSYTRYYLNQKTTISYAQWQRFLQAYRIIKTNYIYPVSDQILINHAIKGMLEGLDRYSTYLNDKDMAYLRQMTTGEYAGIGIEVMPADNALKVITPLDDSPAQKAGILPGDLILEVDHRPLAPIPFQEMVDTLRGAAGSKVTVTIVRAHVNKPLYFSLTRQQLTVQNIKSQLYPHHIAYLRIAFFQQDTADKIKQAIIQLEKQNHGLFNSIIIDLRNNPGGVLQSAAAVSNLFLDYDKLGNNRLIVYSKSRGNKVNYTASAKDHDILNNIPMVILINKGSASAAEIVAGALHDHHRATLVGSQTFGKGSVQAIIPLDKNSAVKLTIALYYTPNGNLINHIGISPDVEIPNNIKNKINTDTALSKALEKLEKKD